MMKNEKELRQHIVNLLIWGDAHQDFEAATKNMPLNLQGKRPKGSPHSPWELLEHLRITLWDILEFSRDAKHKSPDFPKGYWPESQEPPNEKAWDASVKSYLKDLRSMCDLVADESNDLFAKIPYGDGQTLLREALLAADHNAYHLGQLLIVRKMVGAWE
jgi:DinB superfamily